MKLPANKLMPIYSPLYKFNGEVVIHEGIITLLIALESFAKHLNLMIDFMVVKVPFYIQYDPRKTIYKNDKSYIIHLPSHYEISTKVAIGEV